MNPVFWLIVLAAGVAAWFLLSFLFTAIGTVIQKILTKTGDTLTREDHDTNKEENHND